jgi:hypothetical protein
MNIDGLRLMIGHSPAFLPQAVPTPSSIELGQFVQLIEGVFSFLLYAEPLVDTNGCKFKTSIYLSVI